jgi:hypothetical protein
MTKKYFWLQEEDTMLGGWQRKVADLTRTNTFCILPWIHFATRPNGDMRLCCSSNASGAGGDHEVGLVKNEKGQPANFGRETPMSAWNNEYMKDVRLTMLEGNIPSSCTKCFEEESQNVVSKRMWETGTWINDGIDVEELINQNKILQERLLNLQANDKIIDEKSQRITELKEKNEFVNLLKKLDPANTSKYIEILN